jgi:DNA-directed RNA polymerase sigma subunit (sigma70/sigma32)
MAGSLSWITDDSWPSDEGWPYPDTDADAGVDQREELADLTAAADDDVVSLHAAAPHLLDGLGPVERAVISARYGLDGRQPQTIREIQHDLGLPRADLRAALGDGLVKLRSRVG